MKIKLLILSFLCFGWQAWGQEVNKGIAFEAEGTLFAQAVQKAKSTGKLIFLDCYTSWCGPCKMMTNKVFPQEMVGNFMNPGYVSIKIDMEKGLSIIHISETKRQLYMSYA
ncbi:MAG: thioredoxin domain-containing protein, partial [Odoribacter sp.]|nr:thioredoxin domain-containing protein [Odoribacter sp.]